MPRTIRVYQAGDFLQGQTIELSAESFVHCIKVLRLTDNSQIVVFDGRGNRFDAILTRVSKKSAFAVLQSHTRSDQSSLQLTLIQSIIKPDKMDLIIQKAVELGASRIIPCLSANCDVKLDDRLFEKRHKHWHNIMIGACEQCEVDYLPSLDTVTSLSNAISTRPRTDTCIILDPDATSTFSDLPDKTGSVTLLIGPEGGLTAHEISLGEEHHFTSRSLGKRILRSETAAIIGMGLCQWRYGNF